jgi:hypothetical protein
MDCAIAKRSRRIVGRVEIAIRTAVRRLSKPLESATGVLRPSDPLSGPGAKVPSRMELLQGTLDLLILRCSQDRVMVTLSPNISSGLAFASRYRRCAARVSAMRSFRGCATAETSKENNTNQRIISGRQHAPASYIGTKVRYGIRYRILQIPPNRRVRSEGLFSDRNSEPSSLETASGCIHAGQ